MTSRSDTMSRLAGAVAAAATAAALFAAATTGTAASSFTASVVRVTDLSLLSRPSPDPAGIAYVAARNTLVVTDAGVDERSGGITHFAGANVWETRLGGRIVRTADISTRATSRRGMTNEPTGIAWNPSNGHFYVTDDRSRRVYDLDPGADGRIGTLDDRWTRFSTSAGNRDPEGIAYDPADNRLFVADGRTAAVYEYTTAGKQVGRFGVAGHGVRDPVSVEFNSGSGTLFVLGKTSPTIVETTTKGALVRTIDISAAQMLGASGLTYAPAGNGSGAMRFYVVAQGIDAARNPNVVDGKLYELTAPQPSGATTDPAKPASESVDVRVAADSDDAEESDSGNVRLSSSDLELVFDGSNQTVGLRFTGVAVARGARIKNAYVQFQVDETGADAASLEITGLAADNVATFASSSKDISSRRRTSSSIAWKPPPWPAKGAAGRDQRTPNLAAVIQEIVNRPGWSSGNALGLVITGTGRRTAEAFESGAGSAPLLHVELAG